MLARARSLFFRLIASLHRRGLEQDLNEVQSHLNALEGRFLRQGMSPEEARFAARRAFGGIDQLNELHREQRSFLWIEHARQDIRFAYRNVRRNSGFALLAVCTLGLGMAAVTTMFTVVNSVLLRPVPYQKPDRLVQMAEYYRRPQHGKVLARVPEGADWQYRNSVFEALTFYQPGQAVLHDSELPESVNVVRSTPNFFFVLGREPLIGRGFALEDATGASDKVAVVSYAFWQRCLHSDDSAISRKIRIDNTVLSVVGVMPRDFRFPIGIPEADLWIPTARNRLLGGGRPLGRLKAGISVSEAAASLNAIIRQLEDEYPETKADRGIQVRPVFAIGEGNTQVLQILSAAVALVLLIAIVNVANLKLSHAVTREREVAIRFALGSGRARLIRQFLLESTFLGCVSGGLALLLSYVGIELLLRWIPAGFPRATEIAIDGNVFTFVAVVSILASVGFGIVPAISCSKPDLTKSLKDGGHAVSEGRSRRVLRHLLIASEIALTTLLLTGAGLMAKSFWKLITIPLGFEPQGVVAVQFQFPCPACDTSSGINANPAQRSLFVARMLERLRNSPDVESASFTTTVPMTGPSYRPITIEGMPHEPQPVPMESEITPDFFKTLGIRFESGRPPNPGEQAVVINKTMAKMHWPNSTSIGQNLKLGDAREVVPWIPIVGVVEDYKNVDIRQTKEVPQIFTSCQSCGTLLIKVRSQSANVVAIVREAVLAVDKTVLIARVRDMDTTIGNVSSVSNPRFQTVLFNAFAGTAFLLVIVGVLAVTSYAASRRTHEVGIRISLGASQWKVLRLMMRQSMAPACFGLFLGVLGSLALTRVLTSYLIEVSPTDPWIFIASTSLVLVVITLACLMPTLRATAVDPVSALRHE